MANTKIQIKRSSTTAVPTAGSLTAAEPAYSYQSNKLFIGDAAGTGVIAIGGQFFVDQQNLVFNTANSAYDKANAANLFAYNISLGANSYAVSVGAAANAWANAVGVAGNNYTNYVGASGNSYTNYVGASGNSYTNAVGLAGNNYLSILAANNAVGANTYANTVGSSANSYATAMAAAGNNYTDYVGAASNNYSNSTFVKLTAPSQTITGDLAITGNLTFTGNTTFLDSQSLVVGDSLIYLAANNYSGTDILDIGFVANYGNTTGANVHTGLIRDATNKQYYLFQGYDAELQGNNATFTFGANNSSLSVLNADINAGNVTVAGYNVYSWVSAAFTVANSSNGWANTVGVAGNNYTNTVAYNNAIGANNWANTVATAGNNYMLSVTTAGNNYAVSIGASGNAWANAVGTAGNNYTNFVGTSGNSYTVYVGASGNSYTNAVNTIIFNTFSSAANLISGTLPSARLSGAYSGITGVGTITAGVWNGSTVNVAYGGTGIVSAGLNGVLFGSGGAGALQVTSAGTEGQVLQASAAGVPQFGMLDGGSF